MRKPTSEIWAWVVDTDPPTANRRSMKNVNGRFMVFMAWLVEVAKSVRDIDKRRGQSEWTVLYAIRIDTLGGA